MKAKEEFENEECQGFEDYSEQPMLYPTTVEETATPPIKTKSRGKRKSTSEESRNHELFILLKDMRNEMSGGVEKLKEELR